MNDELNSRLKCLSKRDEWNKYRNIDNSMKLGNRFRSNTGNQKRTIKRKYHVGKSKKYPQISVLVSNRTIRNNTNLKKSELKQTPLPEVKKYLIKHGFIKVGAQTPIDILRQMYENASMICGEVQNNNPENLLYNYFNSDVS